MKPLADSLKAAALYGRLRAVKLHHREACRVGCADGEGACSVHEARLMRPPKLAQMNDLHYPKGCVAMTAWQ